LKIRYEAPMVTAKRPIVMKATRTTSLVGAPFEKENVGEEVVITAGEGCIPEESDEDVGEREGGKEPALELRIGMITSYRLGPFGI
jgi:hypothetical protein